jgi:hypothetical protein
LEWKFCDVGYKIGEDFASPPCYDLITCGVPMKCVIETRVNKEDSDEDCHIN